MLITLTRALGVSCKQEDLLLLVKNGFGYRASSAAQILQISNGAFSDSGLIAQNGQFNTFLLPAGAALTAVQLPAYLTYILTGNIITVKENPLFPTDYCYSTSYGCIGKYYIKGTTTGTPPVDPCSTVFNPTITGTLQICPNATTVLTSNVYKSYKWSTGATSQTITVSAGTYGLTVTDNNNCTCFNALFITGRLLPK